MARTRPALQQALRRPLFERLKAAVIEGVLAPGAPIVESVTAKRLGVSRTPVREALLQLEREGLVLSRKDFGFRVTGLSVREVEELFPLVACLERFALEGARFAPAGLRRLRVLNRRIARTGEDVRARVRLDGELHEGLAAAGGNRRLQEELRRLRGAAQRYEFLYGRPSTLKRSVGEHERVLVLLGAGRVREAARLLERHTLDSIPILSAQVAEIERDPLSGPWDQP